MSQASSVSDFFRSVIDFFVHPSTAFGGGILGVISILVAICAFAIVILIVGIVFTHVRIWEHQRMVKARELAKKAKMAEEKKVVNPQWQKVLSAASSGNEAAYRLAIIDADSILDELLDAMGIQGDGVQEKLKAAPRSSFQTIDMAFEAHGIRNAIAHSGPDFRISEREARRVIGLFQKVFEEQGII